MSNVYRFPDRKTVEHRENLRILGDLLSQVYAMGYEFDPELEHWIREAELALRKRIIQPIDMSSCDIAKSA